MKHKHLKLIGSRCWWTLHSGSSNRSEC